jgi:hypothetical protein
MTAPRNTSAAGERGDANIMQYFDDLHPAMEGTPVLSAVTKWAIRGVEPTIA